MSHDLFGDVLVRPPSVRSRRSSVVAFSIVAHGAVLAAVIIAPVVASDSLPLPQRALSFFTSPDLVVPVVPPPRRVAVDHAPLVKTITVGQAAAPTVAPTGISPEPGDSSPGDFIGSGGPPIGTIDGIGSTAIGTVVAPAAPPPVTPIPLHKGIREPRKIVDVAPVYPQFAQMGHIEGLVIIEATIDTRGGVQAARVLRSVPFLDEAALAAVRQWRYTPALLNGVPVPVIMTVTVNFTLQRR
jgi:periplasmic protein TonB